MLSVNYVLQKSFILLVINSVEKLIRGLRNYLWPINLLEKIGQVVDKEIETQERQTPLTQDFRID